MTAHPTTAPLTTAELTDVHIPLTQERQLARQQAASHQIVMQLYEQLGRFTTEMLATDDGILRGSLMGRAEFMVGVTARLQGVHHAGARTLTNTRADGKRRVEVHHQVSHVAGPGRGE